MGPHLLGFVAMVTGAFSPREQLVGPGCDAAEGGCRGKNEEQNKEGIPHRPHQNVCSLIYLHLILKPRKDGDSMAPAHVHCAWLYPSLY